MKMRKADVSRSDFPEDWHESRLKSVFKVIYRYPTYYNIEYVENGVSEIRGEALSSDGKIVALDDERKISSETSEQFPRTQLEYGDIVMSVRGTMGKVGFVDERYVGANITANLIRLNPRKKFVDGKFLRWLFLSEYFKQELDIASPFTTIKTVVMPHFEAIRMPVPCIDEQTRIAQYLDQTCSAIDRAIAVKQQQLEKLVQLRKSIIYKAVTKGLDDSVEMRDSGVDQYGLIPSHWGCEKLKRVSVSLQTGPFGSQLHSDEYIEGGTPVINPAHMGNGSIAPDWKVSVDLDTKQRLIRHVLEMGDIVFARRGDLGRCALVAEKEAGWLCGTGSLRMRPDQLKVNPEYLISLFGTKSVAEWLSLGSVGSTMENLSTKILEKLPVIVPPLNEQKTILSFLSNKLEKIIDVQLPVVRQIDVLREYKKSLIHECVTGKRRITEVDLRRVA
jgi:type I restriction enzyme S subunit